MLAAEAILGARTGDAADVRARFLGAVRHELVADHRMSVRLLTVLERRRGAELALRVAGANGWTRRNFARWLFEDYPRAVLVTPRRWHRRMLAGPGAFSSRPC